MQLKWCPILGSNLFSTVWESFHPSVFRHPWIILPVVVKLWCLLIVMLCEWSYSTHDVLCIFQHFNFNKDHEFRSYRRTHLYSLYILLILSNHFASNATNVTNHFSGTVTNKRIIACCQSISLFDYYVCYLASLWHNPK